MNSSINDYFLKLNHLTKFIDETVIDDNFNPKVFYSCIQYIAYNKAILFNDIESANLILNEHYYKNIQKLDEKIKNYDVDRWNIYKEEIYFNAYYNKFMQNKNIANELLKNPNIINKFKDDSIYNVDNNLLIETINQVYKHLKFYEALDKIENK